MFTEMVETVLAVLAFVLFPFAVISAAAGVLVLLDRLSEMRHHHHGHARTH